MAHKQPPRSEMIRGIESLRIAIRFARNEPIFGPLGEDLKSFDELNDIAIKDIYITLLWRYGDILAGRED